MCGLRPVWAVWLGCVWVTRGCGGAPSRGPLELGDPGGGRPARAAVWRVSRSERPALGVGGSYALPPAASQAGRCGRPGWCGSKAEGSGRAVGLVRTRRHLAAVAVKRRPVREYRAWFARGRRCHVCCVHGWESQLCACEERVWPAAAGTWERTKGSFVFACVLLGCASTGGVLGLWCVGVAGSTLSLGLQPSPRGPVQHRALRGRWLPKRVRTRRVGANRRRTRCRRGRGNEPLPVRSARLPPRRRLTWALPHLLRGRGVSEGGAWRARLAPRSSAELRRERAAPHSWDSSGSGARVSRWAGPARAVRECVWVCGGGVGAGARARARLCVGAPPKCAPRARRYRPWPYGALLAGGGRAQGRPAVSAGEPGRRTEDGRGMACGGTQGWADSEQDRGRPPGRRRRETWDCRWEPKRLGSLRERSGFCRGPARKASWEWEAWGRESHPARPYPIWSWPAAKEGCGAGLREGAEDGLLGPVPFLSAHFLPPPQNQTTHSPSAGLAEKQRSLLFCVALSLWFITLRHLVS